MLRALLNDRAVELLVDPGRLVEEIRRALLDPTAVEAEREAITIGGSWFAAMTAGDDSIVSVKNVGVYPGNPQRGLPLVRALTLVFDSRTGEPLLAYEANSATGLRTAAASLLAAKLLGARKGGVLGIIGAGAQATWHGLVFKRLLPPSEILVHSRTRGRAERLASMLGGRAVGLEEANRESDILVAATSSREPVVLGELLRTDAIVISVGAPAPVRELDETVRRRARCLLADTRPGVLRESPDGEGWERVVGLDELLRGKACSPGDVRVYKSVGRPLFDLAISRLITKRLGLAVSTSRGA